MFFVLPFIKRQLLNVFSKKKSQSTIEEKSAQWLYRQRALHFYSFIALILCFAYVCYFGISLPAKSAQTLISPLQKNFVTQFSKQNAMDTSTETESQEYEVFGYAPYWTNWTNIDYSLITTFAYFGIEVNPNGSLVRDDKGYATFKSERATTAFAKAHENGARVIVTITQMKNNKIITFLDDENAQSRAIDEIVTEIKNRKVDGVNVDFEYAGNPGSTYRDKYTKFVANLSKRVHDEIPNSKVSIAVYASVARSPKMYDLVELNKHVDLVFMMAYDYAVAGAEKAMPTAPLHGYKDNKYYWLDVSTSVEDFLKLIPANKLVLGVPYYSYDYVVYSPEVKADTRPYYSWRGRPRTRTYSDVQSNVTPEGLGKHGYKSGWDEKGKVEWRAYYVPATDTWRILFIDSKDSLRHKYQFAKSNKLAGVGMWALGFDNGKSELWDLLREEFGKKYADSSIGR